MMSLMTLLGCKIKPKLQQEHAQRLGPLMSENYQASPLHRGGTPRTTCTTLLYAFDKVARNQEKYCWLVTSASLPHNPQIASRCHEAFQQPLCARNHNG